MVNKNFIKLVTALTKIGLSDGSDMIRTRVPRELLHDVISLALDFGFKLIIDDYDNNTDKYVLTIKPLYP